MKVTPAIIYHEFLGLKAKVVRASNPSIIGISGEILDETRNTIVLFHEDNPKSRRRKTIVKKQAVFHLTLPDATVVEIDGKTIIGRPEERLKRRIRRLW
ncbi:MAG: ribonuclease P protein subunit [Candidatus Bathyarchaeota archaeon]|nr:MAG: ribonuclease P protein subunit [Candidatus Bathyarchaeota archaeon]